MSVALSEEMAASARQPQSMQPGVSGQSSTSAPANISQTGPTNTTSPGGYMSQIPSYIGSRWQPSSGLPPSPGPPGLPVPSGPWISIRPVPSGAPVSQNSPNGNTSTGPLTSSENSPSATATGNSKPALTPGNTGNSANLGPYAQDLPGHSTPSRSSESPPVPPVPPGISAMGIQGSTSSHVSTIVGASVSSVASPLQYGQRPPGEAIIQGPRSMPIPSPSSASENAPTINSTFHPSQYTPYINVPPVPAPVAPWMFPPIQMNPRPIPTFTIANPYLPSIRPIVPLQASIMNKTSDNTIPLAPPGEQGFPSKSVSTEVGKISSVSSVSDQDVNGHLALSSTINSEKNMPDSASKTELLKEDTVDVWTAHKTPDGVVYYYNSISGESTYEKPLGFHGEVDRVTAQPTPISWEMIGGTGWALVTTNDAKKYYYHTVTQATSWQVPAEVVEYRKRQSEEKLSVSKGNSDKGAVSFSLNAPEGASIVREGQKVGQIATSSALDLIKKKLQDSGGSDNTDGNSNRLVDIEGTKEKLKDNNTDNSSESSSDSDEEEQGPTKDERVSQFKEMLKEKGIVPFSKWEKELPKILFDPRFKAVPSHTERRSIFYHYVRTRAEEERKEKRAAQRAAIEGFKQLLEEASKDFSHDFDYEKLAKAWSADPRFDALERKDREILLNERILPLKKAEEERIRAIRDVAASGFNAMLKEMGEVTSTSRWSRIKDKLRNDPRYRTVRREDREALFNSYVAELQAVEQEAERKAKAKREEEDKLREREREMRKRKEREEQELEKVRAKVRKREAVTAYQALLMEKIKDPEASWTESKPKLEKDSLGRATNPELDLSEREKLFRDHVKSLYERCERDYRILLAEVMTIDAAKKQNEDGKTILNSWSEVKKLVKADPRYSKMPRRDREAWWRRYADDMQRKLKPVSSKEEKHSGADGGKSGALEAVSRRSSSYR